MTSPSLGAPNATLVGAVEEFFKSAVATKVCAKSQAGVQIAQEMSEMVLDQRMLLLMELDDVDVELRHAPGSSRQLHARR